MKTTTTMIARISLGLTFLVSATPQLESIPIPGTKENTK
jgi:hypothetical protein